MSVVGRHSAAPLAGAGQLPYAIVTVGAGIAFVMTLAWRILTFAGFQNDHYVHLARAQQLILGDWPIRDFVDPGMPLMYGTSAAAWWLWDGSPWTELVLTACGFAIGAACTFVIARRLSGSILVASAATLLEVLIAPRNYSYPKVILYAVAAWAILAVVDAPTSRRVLVLAGITAIGFLFRHDHGLYLGAAAAAAVVASTWSSGWRIAARQVAVLAGGAALMVAPWLAYVAYHQGLVSYFASGIAFSGAEARNSGVLSLRSFNLSPGDLLRVRPPARPTATVDWKEETPREIRQALERRYGLEPVPGDDYPHREYFGSNASPVTMRALANDPHVADVSGLDRIVEWSAADAILARVSPARLETGDGWHVDENAHVWLFYVFHSLPMLAAVALWRRRWIDAQRWPLEFAAVGSLIVLAVLVNVGLLRDNLPVWLPDAIVPPVLLGAFAVPVAWRADFNRRVVRIAARVSLAVLIAMTAGAVAVVGDVRSQVERSRASLGIDGMSARFADLRTRLSGRHREGGSPPSGVSEALLPFFEYVSRCTSPTDRLVMTRLYPDVFVLAERGFAGGHVAFLEGFYSSPSDQELTLARIRRESVPFVLVLEDQEDTFRRGFERVADHVRTHYAPMADIAVEETARLSVFVENDRRSTTTDAATGWPCFT